MDLKGVALLLISVFAIISSASCADVPTITVVGEGAVTVPADIVYVSVSASSDNENVTLAYEESSQKLNRSIEAIEQAGIKGCDILKGYSTGVQSYKICTKGASNESICVNKTLVTLSASLRLTKPEQGTIDRIKEVARQAGADASVSGYALSDATEAKNEARKKAVENARKTAEAMVTAAGGRLGKIIDISESPLSFWGVPLDMLFPSVDTSITESGMVEVKTTVVVTYEIVS